MGWLLNEDEYDFMMTNRYLITRTCIKSASFFKDKTGEQEDTQIFDNPH